MPEKPSPSKQKLSTDWLLRGSLTKIGDTFDRFLGRKWVPSSSIATSELIERIKKLIDTEAKEIPSKGIVVPHNIKLKMQWDKFSTDADEALRKLQYELLAATVDLINDSRYYTYAPISMEIKPDYFIEGVKLYASFDKFTDSDEDGEMNVTVPAINVGNFIPESTSKKTAAVETFIARFEIDGIKKEKRLEFTTAASISVGRIGSNNLVIDDVSVSKIHGALSVNVDGGLSVADTGSTNGTFLNDRRISYGKATQLGSDGRVKFGTVDVTFELVSSPFVMEPDSTVGTTSCGDVEIGGFEFKSRNPAEKSEISQPEVTISDDTLKVTPEKELLAAKVSEQNIKAEASTENVVDRLKTEANPDK